VNAAIFGPTIVFRLFFRRPRTGRLVCKAAERLPGRFLPVA
jgi:hypothetical protein